MGSAAKQNIIVLVSQTVVRSHLKLKAAQCMYNYRFSQKLRILIKVLLIVAIPAAADYYGDTNPIGRFEHQNYTSKH